MEIADYHPTDIQSPEVQTTLKVTTEYFENVTTITETNEPIQIQSTSPDLLSMVKPVQSVTVTPLLNKSQLQEETKPIEETKIRYEYYLPPKGPSGKIVVTPRDDTLNFEKIATRTDDLLKSVERTLARSQEVNTRIRRNSITDSKSLNQSPGIESYTYSHPLPASYEVERTSEIPPRNPSSLISPNIQSIIDRYRQSGILQESPKKYYSQNKSGEGTPSTKDLLRNSQVGTRNSYVSNKQENYYTQGTQDSGVKEKDLRSSNIREKSGLSEITNHTGQPNIYDTNKPYEYKNYSTVNYKEYLSPSNQPGSKSSVLDKDKDKISYSVANPYTYSNYNSQMRNTTDKNYGITGISTSTYLQRPETIISSSNTRPLANSSTYLASQAPAGQENSLLGERIKEFKHLDPATDDVSKRVVTVIDNMIQKYLPENRSRSSSISQVRLSPQKSHNQPGEMRNSQYGVSYVNYPDSNLIGTGYLSNSQFLQKANYSDKYLNPNDPQNQYPYNSNQHMSPGSGAGAYESNFNSVQTGAFGNLPPRQFEEERFEMEDHSQMHQNNTTQIFQSPLVTKEENLKQARGYTEEKERREDQAIPFNIKEEDRRDQVLNNNETRDLAKPENQEEEREEEGGQSEAFSNQELSSDKKMKKITFKAKPCEENNEEKNNLREADLLNNVNNNQQNENHLLEANLQEFIDNPDSSNFDFDKEGIQFEEKEIANNIVQEEPMQSKLPPRRSRTKEIPKTIWIVPPVRRVIENNYYMNFDEYQNKVPVLTYIFDKYRNLELKFSSENKIEEFQIA